MKGAILTTIASVLILFLLSSCFPSEKDLRTSFEKDKYYSMSLEELKKEARSPSYDDLFRNNEQYIGELVYYQAEVIQVLEVGKDTFQKDTYQLRGNIRKKEYSWDDTVFLRYSGPRLLEDDIIEFVGVVKGSLTYESILRAEITIPDINILKARIITKAGER